jgi:hypothetical protein
MKIDIEIAIHVDTESDQVFIQTDTRLDSVEQAKIAVLKEHLRAFCEWFKEEEWTTVQ